jgi:hypothetical protein
MNVWIIQIKALGGQIVNVSRLDPVNVQPVVCASNRALQSKGYDVDIVLELSKKEEGQGQQKEGGGRTQEIRSP